MLSIGMNKTRLKNYYRLFFTRFIMNVEYTSLKKFLFEIGLKPEPWYFFDSVEIQIKVPD